MLLPPFLLNTNVHLGMDLPPYPAVTYSSFDHYHEPQNTWKWQGRDFPLLC